jgi:hypothetical protein
MRYSQELIELLPNIVAKASALQELALGEIPNKSVQRYYREAHSCYFYGLNRACAVLCRAILEAALKEILGPSHRTHELIELAGMPRPKTGNRCSTKKGLRLPRESAMPVIRRFITSTFSTKTTRIPPSNNYCSTCARSWKMSMQGLTALMRKRILCCCQEVA